MSATDTPTATPDATPPDAARLPAGITRTASGTFRARLGKISLGSFPSVEAAVGALEAGRAALGLPPPHRRRRPGEPPPPAGPAGALPHSIQRRPSGRFGARFRHAGGFVDAGIHDSVAGAVAARDKLRAELGLPPIIAAPEPPAPPPTPEPPPAPEPAPEPPTRRARAIPLDGPLAGWRRQTQARIDALVARVEAEEGLGKFTLPPDPTKKNAPP